MLCVSLLQSVARGRDKRTVQAVGDRRTLDASAALLPNGANHDGSSFEVLGGGPQYGSSAVAKQQFQPEQSTTDNQASVESNTTIIGFRTIDKPLTRGTQSLQLPLLALPLPWLTITILLLAVPPQATSTGRERPANMLQVEWLMLKLPITAVALTSLAAMMKNGTMMILLSLIFP